MIRIVRGDITEIADVQAILKNTRCKPSVF